MKKMLVKNSKRLSFRLMTGNDGELLYELDQDPEVMKYINGGKLTTMEEINNLYIPRMLKYRNENEGWGLWKVSVTQSKLFIGWVLVRPMFFFTELPEFNNIELGWRFKQASWGKGYATEAALTIKEALLLNSQSANAKINQFSAIAIEDNIGSINIMKKLGMTFLKKDLHPDLCANTQVVFYQLQI